MKTPLGLLSIFTAPILGGWALAAGWLTGFTQLWQILLFAWPASIALIWIVLSRPLGVTIESREGASSWSGLSQFFHWFMAFCMFGTAALMYYMVNLGNTEDPVIRAQYSFLLKQHKSIGLIILFLVAIRFIWNSRRPRPPVAAGITPAQYLASKASHYFLYCSMLVVPLLGWMASMTYGGRTFFFGLFELPVWLPKNMDWAYVLQPAHIWAAWIMFAVVAIHATAALWHHWVRRDATLVQMLPRALSARHVKAQDDRAENARPANDF